MWLCFRRWGMGVWWGEVWWVVVGGRMGLVVGGEEGLGLGWEEVVGALPCRVVSGGEVKGSLRRGIEGVAVGTVGEEEGGIEHCNDGGGSYEHCLGEIEVKWQAAAMCTTSDLHALVNE